MNKKKKSGYLYFLSALRCVLDDLHVCGEKQNGLYCAACGQHKMHTEQHDQNIC